MRLSAVVVFFVPLTWMTVYGFVPFQQLLGGGMVKDSKLLDIPFPTAVVPFVETGRVLMGAGPPGVHSKFPPVPPVSTNTKENLDTGSKQLKSSTKAASSAASVASVAVPTSKKIVSASTSTKNVFKNNLPAELPTKLSQPPGFAYNANPANEIPAFFAGAAEETDLFNTFSLVDEDKVEETQTQAPSSGTNSTHYHRFPISNVLPESEEADEDDNNDTAYYQ